MKGLWPLTELCDKCCNAYEETSVFCFKHLSL